MIMMDDGDNDDDVIYYMYIQLLTNLHPFLTVWFQQATKQVRKDKVKELTDMDHAIYMLHDGTQEMVRRKELEMNYVRKMGMVLCCYGVLLLQRIIVWD